MGRTASEKWRLPRKQVNALLSVELIIHGLIIQALRRRCSERPHSTPRTCGFTAPSIVGAYPRKGQHHA